MNCAQAGALGAGVQMEWQVKGAYANYLPNAPLMNLPPIEQAAQISPPRTRLLDRTKRHARRRPHPRPRGGATLRTPRPGASRQKAFEEAKAGRAYRSLLPSTAAPPIPLGQSNP